MAMKRAVETDKRKIRQAPRKRPRNMFKRTRIRAKQRGLVYSLRGKAAILAARNRRTGFRRKRRR